MDRGSKYSITDIIFLLLIIIWEDRFFNATFIDAKYFMLADGIVLPFLCYYYIKNKNSIFVDGTNFSKCIILFGFAYLAGTITSYVIYEQPILKTIFRQRGVLVLLLYFYLHIRRVSEKTLLISIVIYSIMLLGICFMQNMEPDIRLFGQNYDDMGYVREDFRNGILRIRIDGIIWTLIAFFFYVFRSIEYNSFKNTLFTILFAVTIYLSITRQIIVSALLSPAFVILFYNVKFKKGLLFFYLVIGGIFLIFYFDSLFGFFIESTTTDISDDGYIRYFSYVYYLNHICDNILSLLFGHGYALEGYELARLREVLWGYGYYASDIGLVGLVYDRGIIYVMIFLYIMYNVVWKYRKVLPYYLVAFVIARLITSVMIYPMHLIQVAVLLYIVDLYINNSKLCLK